MSENLTAISYLISAIFFILALKGLSHPESARNGNMMGIVGMIIAIVTTAFNPNVLSYEMIILGILIGLYAIIRNLDIIKIILIYVKDKLLGK